MKCDDGQLTSGAAGAGVESHVARTTVEYLSWPPVLGQDIRAVRFRFV